MRNSFSIGPMKVDYSRNKNVIRIVRIQFEVEIPLKISNNTYEAMR